jgi:NAD(P)-dependent dehydrogenase (short-subunit alcohol dehydrogenase family)
MGAAKTAPIALVTGASRGIGRGIALALAGAGFNVAVNYARNKQAADQTCAEIAALGRKAIPVHGDVSLAADRTRIVEETEKRLGPISLLVNNAGVAPKVRADVLEAGEESFDRLVATNLKGPYFLTQFVARKMIRWRAEGLVDQPRIVFVTSVSAFAASTNRGDYCLSKAGLSMAVKLFAARLAGEGIGVYEVQPGIIRTDMSAQAQERYDRLIFEEGLLPIARWGEPEDVGRAVVAIAEGRFAYSTGIALQVDGGFHLRTL